MNEKFPYILSRGLEGIQDSGGGKKIALTLRQMLDQREKGMQGARTRESSDGT